MAQTRQEVRPGVPAPLVLGYAAVVYLFFLAVLCYSIGFFAGAGVPKGIDQGTRSAWPLAVAIDLLLLMLFAIQHTVMARPWFKRRWTRLVPVPAERATFVRARADPRPSPPAAPERGEPVSGDDMGSRESAGPADADGQVTASPRVGMFPPFGLLEQGPETARAFLARAGEAASTTSAAGTM